MIEHISFPLKLESCVLKKKIYFFPIISIPDAREHINMKIHTDTLTGFLPVSDFEGTYKESLNKSLETGEPLSIVIIDLDNFRKFNENYGNAFGNDVLKQLAGLIKEKIRKESKLIRFGGEEFIILLPGTEREQAFLMFEKIRDQWDNDRIFNNNGDNISTRLTFSAGIATCSADGTDSAELLRKCEQALYRAKVSGRNRICIAQEEKMIPKTAHYTATQLERLSDLAKSIGVADALLLREALDHLLRKYTVAKKIN
jgi:diguanylate cyclase (GGDEF)-like protein